MYDAGRQHEPKSLQPGCMKIQFGLLAMDRMIAEWIAERDHRVLKASIGAG
jgi:hypothetical protein